MEPILPPIPNPKKINPPFRNAEKFYRISCLNQQNPKRKKSMKKHCSFFQDTSQENIKSIIDPQFLINPWPKNDIKSYPILLDDVPWKTPLDLTNLENNHPIFKEKILPVKLETASPQLTNMFLNDKLGLLPDTDPSTWKAFSIQSDSKDSGMIFIPNIFSPTQHVKWMKHSLNSLIEQPNKNNHVMQKVNAYRSSLKTKPSPLFPDMEEYSNNSQMWRRAIKESYPEISKYLNELDDDDDDDCAEYHALNIGKSKGPKGSMFRLLSTLRWSTCGYHHDWVDMVYHETDKTELPNSLQSISKFVSFLLRYDGKENPLFIPQASIVNFYHWNSRLGGHFDVSEPERTMPLVSASFGHTGILLVGGTPGNPATDSNVYPLLVRSGDIVVYHHKSRASFHGVPRILQEVPPSLQIPSTIDVTSKQQLEDLAVKLFCHQRGLRLNLNIRQVLGFKEKELDSDYAQNTYNWIQSLKNEKN